MKETLPYGQSDRENIDIANCKFCQVLVKIEYTSKLVNFVSF
jgi:hypothetical protein